MIVAQVLSCGLASAGASFEDLGAPLFSPGANLSAIPPDSHPCISVVGKDLSLKQQMFKMVQNN